MVIKTAWYWPENRHINHWDRIERPEIDPYNRGQLISTMEQNKDPFSTTGANTTGHMSTCKKVSLHTDLTPFTKSNSKWITKGGVGGLGGRFKREGIYVYS